MNRNNRSLRPSSSVSLASDSIRHSWLPTESCVITRRFGEERATRWESDGGSGYTLEDAERAEPGTSVTLHLKPEDAEDGLKDYASEYVLKSIVRKYSNFVAYPIRMKVERKEIERDEKGKPKEGAEEKTVVQEETLNSMKAIWTRPKSEVSEDEYKEFYKHISHDWNEPLETISAKLEGNFEAQALLFIPSKAPFDLYSRDMAHRGIQLYVKRVFIMDECKELMPEYLRFVRGVVDSEGLSLNVSREILQQDRQIKAIRSFLVKKILDTLKEMLEKRKEKYLSFWAEFGPGAEAGPARLGGEAGTAVAAAACANPAITRKISRRCRSTSAG